MDKAMNEDYARVIDRWEICTTRDNSVLASIIAWCQASLRDIVRGRVKDIPAHALLRCVYTDGSYEYFESHYPGGWAGPKPKQLLVEWLNEQGKQRKIFSRTLPGMTDFENNVIFDRCMERVKSSEWSNTYDLKQLARMYFMSRLGLRVKPSQKDVCSEAVAKVLFPVFDLRIWPSRPVRGFDEITPWYLQNVPFVKTDILYEELLDV